MAVMIRDQYVEAVVRANRQQSDASRWDECWQGVLVMPPLPNNEHQQLVLDFCSIFVTAIDRNAGDCCLPGANVSDREEDWLFNYRSPDVIVALKDGLAIDRGSYWLGGPDLIVEVISPNEEPYAKFDFYADIGVREILVLHRDPWLLERFILRNGKYENAERCKPGSGSVTCEVIPVTFSIPRPGQIASV